MKGNGLKRYLVHCVKCGYEWLAYTPNPTRCALCNCKNISEAKRKTSRELADERAS
jgi:predicted Zn-ribbon and HTH transcriptional regulator